jgi:hypothetical protein
MILRFAVVGDVYNPPYGKNLASPFDAKELLWKVFGAAMRVRGGFFA